MSKPQKDMIYVINPDYWYCGPDLATDEIVENYLKKAAKLTLECSDTPFLDVLKKKPVKWNEVVKLNITSHRDFNPNNRVKT